ncbi:MAG: chlorite dismutase family protein [Gemmatimonadales bacterium]
MTPPQSGLAAHPPETLEGWYALHQLFALEHAALSADANVPVPANSARSPELPRVEATPESGSSASPKADAGWSAYARLIGSRAMLIAMHFRSSLEALSDAQHQSQRRLEAKGLRLVYSFLSVTEAGLYHITAQLAREATERGGAVGDETYTAELAKRVAAERESAHVRRRLYPPLPDDMPYVSFYPMSKRRDAGQNWYTLSLDERSRLMYAHGLTGRRYAGRVVQIITGAIGFDAWEWGVTLFAKNPLEFKKLVTDMRFDEVSAKYAEFGDFYVGRLIAPERLDEAIETF